tara:strand:+ start:574 stop:1482 length:909 start_codon:yes stop_codon:yes gene_type:complete
MVKGLHIELTNKCYLKCSKCARTTFIDKFGIKNWNNHDLSLDDLKSFLNIDLTGIQITFCGDYGDPIYHPELIKIVTWFKEKNAIVKITTNGSYKDKTWWEELVSKLTADDEICFSIDGIPENFTQYRVNADWKSIAVGLQVVGSSNVNSVWKYILFRFNEHTIDQAKTLSESFNIKAFNIMHSDRFDNDDELMPSSTNALGDQYSSIVTWRNLDNRKRAEQKIDPKCSKGTKHYITADGHYLPCCYVGDWRFYYKSKFYKNKNSYKIQDTTIEKILEQEQDFFDNLQTTKPDYCTFNCPKI